MKQTIQFTDQWSTFFADHGMKTFDDFFERFDRDYHGKETLSKKSKADVQMLDFMGDKVFYIKRFYYPGYKNILRAWRAFGSVVTYGRLEWENANLLLDNGIGAYQPVCYGETTISGLEMRSFVVTEKLRTTSMDSFVMHRWDGLSRQLQENIVIELAKTVQRIHGIGISMRDLYIKHVYIDEEAMDNGIYRFSFIDLEKMARGVKSASRKAKDVGRLYYSMTEADIDNDIKSLLVNTYAAGRSGKAARLKRIIHARQADMTKRKRKNSKVKTMSWCRLGNLPLSWQLPLLAPETK